MNKINNNSEEVLCKKYPHCKNQSTCRFYHPEDKVEWRKMAFKTCDEKCKIVLVDGKSSHCERDGCANGKRYTKYFTKVMGYSTIPNACIPEQSIVQPQCKSCLKHKTLLHSAWRKETKMGRLDFECLGCQKNGPEVRDDLIKPKTEVKTQNRSIISDFQV